MNWTGGRLQRHSGSKGNAVARQKQHFAKVKQNLGSKSRKKSPIRLSIFDHVIENRQQSRHRSSAVESQHSDRDHSLQRGRSQNIPNLLSRHEETHIPQIQQRPRGHSIPIKRRASPVPEEDLYNATPPPRPRPPKMKREPSLESPQLDQHEELDESLSEKRRRLLRKGDWVGMGTHRPVGVKFVTSTADENVGRRRKVKDGPRARYQSRQSHITSPFANKRRRLYSPAFESPQRGHQKTDVRIFIGGKVMNPGVSSSSVRDRASSRRAEDRRRSHTELSDMMLLDGGEGATPRSNKDYRQPLYDSPLRHVERAPTPFNLKPLPSSEQDTSSLVRRYENMKSLPQKDNRYPGSSSSKLGSGRNFLINQDTPSQNHTIPSFEEEEAAHVVSSRPSSIHHPAPRSSKKSSLLLLESPEKYGSTIAHVGEDSLVVPESQQLQNDIWQSWLVISSDNDQNEPQDDENYDQNAARRVSISPGISTRFANRSKSRPNRIVMQSSPLESPAINEEDEYGEEEEEHEAVSANSEPGKDLAEKNDEDSEDVHQENINTNRPISPFRKFRLTRVDDDKDALPQTRKEDRDELWSKFVFGDGSDSSDEVDEVEPSRTGLRKSYQASEYANFSTAGQPATEISPSSRTQNGGSISQVLTTQLSRTSSFSDNTTYIPVVTSAISLRSIQRQAARHPPQENNRISSYNSSTQQNTESSILTSAAESVSPLVSMIAHAPSSSSSRASGPGIASSSGSNSKKVVFTKPKPFKGRKADRPQEEEPLHIGRPFSLKDRLAEFEMRKGKRRGR